jgi:hypothetical protein
MVGRRIRKDASCCDPLLCAARRLVTRRARGYLGITVRTWTGRVIEDGFVEIRKGGRAWGGRTAQKSIHLYRLIVFWGPMASHDHSAESRM